MEGRRWRAASKLGTNLIVASHLPSDYLVAISVLHWNLSRLHLIGILHSLSLASCLQNLASKGGEPHVSYIVIVLAASMLGTFNLISCGT